MKRYLAGTGALLLTAVIALSCGDDGGSGSALDGDDASGTPGSGVATVASDEEPTDFTSLRDDLIERLDSIGVSIGFAPDEVRDQLLESCHDLELFADAGRVGDICDALDDAIERGDPGLIDLILDELRKLEPN